MAAGKKTKTPQRIYNVRPDTMDFRNKMYEAIILSALADYLFGPINRAKSGTETDE